MCVLLFLVVNVRSDGWWLTIPSADSGCGSLISDSYFWDTQNPGWEWERSSSKIWRNNSWSGTIPRGDYNENIRQYFCTGKVDSMPLGSYCFYQNIQNCKIISCEIGYYFCMIQFSFEY